MKLIVPLFLASTIALTGCNATGPRESAGGILGAAGGALIGAQFGSGSGKIAMAVLGALAGSTLGQHIGRTMDARDAQRMSNTFESAPSNRTVSWNNPDTGYQHHVTPEPAYAQNNGQPCREFTHTAYIGGKPQEVYGTACRQADGSWKVVH